MDELAKVLEMTEDAEEVGGDVIILLRRWQKDMLSQNCPVRHYLMHHLSNMGLTSLYKRFAIDNSYSYIITIVLQTTT